ncbi:protein ROOT HAIR DEFECTIVE 3 2-like [Pyrus ussuriensis x Pyrus communis]|uniref:Protein ROOT HAIR DEFECTIVE 3 2-like n=1 Tax=Pyrus ussuriensis x Pyrus communis TaxID=2448454 RepID=A0A5N5IEU1_9ROSA|nr:protein ROOT HAIR DEFECTIVE 3 2-like [Pyrus ussuriensis x Pyrus communis]
MMKEDICTMQLICGNSEFNVAGLNSFVQKVKFDKCGNSYAVVAIMGPQSGGKSTLMNHLFDTGFQEMEIESGKSQTTKGIWIAKCIGIEPCTIAMDLEGSDSSERGEDDTTLEKQIALFALAVSDILLINMWYNDICREHAASIPLLKTIFQVMMRLCGNPPKKTTLMFVVRDKPAKAPFVLLEKRLREDTEKMWKAVSKSQAHKNSPLTVFFNVEVVALSNYLEKEETFKEEVTQLRQRLVNSISPGGLVGDRKGVVPASVFSRSIQEMWRVIKLNKDLDLPAHKVMVATVRCEEIYTDIFKQLMENNGWLALQKAALTGLVPDFGRRVSSILYNYLSEYDKEVVDFEEGVRKSKRHMLESKALQSAQAVYDTMLGHLCSKAFEEFKVRVASLNPEKRFVESIHACNLSTMHEFRQGCADAAAQHSNWSFSSIVEKLQRDIVHAASCIHSTKLSELKVKCEEQLVASLTSQADPEFGNGGEGMWVSIRRILKLETEKAISRLISIKVSFKLNEKEFNAMGQDLSNFARNEVEKRARYNIVHNKVLTQMQQRFVIVFCYDSNSQPRVWKKKKQITAATKEASSASLKILAVMATIDLDEKPNYVEGILFSCLTKETEDSLPSSWENDTLFTPVRCQELWDKFKKETQKHIEEATSTVKAHKRRKSMTRAKLAIGAAGLVVNTGLAVIGIPPVFS